MIMLVSHLTSVISIGRLSTHTRIEHRWVPEWKPDAADCVETSLEIITSPEWKESFRIHVLTSQWAEISEAIKYVTNMCVKTGIHPH